MGRQQRLPAYRPEGQEGTLPPFALARSDVEGFLHELRGFHEAFRDCFTRREPREHFVRYMVGQFSPLERKSIEPMALEVDRGDVRGMQRFISDDAWNADQMRRIYNQLVDDDIGAPNGVVIVDQSWFAKKGTASVGVARQYCGSLGKVDNCQVGVFAAFASHAGYALVDTRLFVPEPSLSDAYAMRRARCKVPEELTFQTKPQLAAAMVRGISQGGILRFKYVVADCLCGNIPVFWRPVGA
jgi:SRSO17 transposase